MTQDPVVGAAGGCSVFLSDLSFKQVRDLREKMTGVSKDRESRKSMEAAVVEAVGKGVKTDVDLEGYVWCYADPHRPIRIAFHVCRERQRAGERCPKNLSCDQKLNLMRTRKRRFRMAKKETGEAAASEPRPTKSGLLREAFAKKKEWSEEDLLKQTGYDKANLRTAMAILRDAERTKDPIYIYAKEKGVFALGDMKDVPPKRERKSE